MSSPNRKFIEIKYRLAWYFGTAICFILYITGLAFLYGWYQKKLLKHKVMIALMYHRVSDDGKWPDITVSTENFARQIQYLKNNFKVISGDKMIAELSGDGIRDVNEVIITFDDGFKDNYDYAYPILKSYDMPAIIFVATDYIPHEYALNRSEMMELMGNHIDIGAHTITHPVLASLEADEAEREIAGSKKELEIMLGKEVKYFAYPYGKIGRDLAKEHINMVKHLGFKAAFVTDNGFISEKSDLFSLHRIGVRNVPMFVFKVRLSGIFENGLVRLFRRMARL